MPSKKNEGIPRNKKKCLKNGLILSNGEDSSTLHPIRKGGSGTNFASTLGRGCTLETPQLGIKSFVPYGEG